MSIRLLYLNVMLMIIGNCGAPLIIHLYFIYGGKRVWLATWLQSVGFPTILIPLLISYLRRLMKAQESNTTKPILMKFPLFIASMFIGLIGVLTNYTYAFGMGHLPASTAFLIISLQLAFLSLFAFLIVKHKFTGYSFLAIVLLVAGAACLSVVAKGDKLSGETDKQYYLGFVLTIVCAALGGLLYPLIELAYKKARQEITYTLVMESQVVMAFFATLVSTIAMLKEHDFKVIPLEAAEFQLGEAKYYIVLVSISILSLCALVGATGVIFSASCLSAGIMVGFSLPISEVLAATFSPEKFGLGKVKIWTEATGFTCKGRFDISPYLQKLSQICQLTNLSLATGMRFEIEYNLQVSIRMALASIFCSLSGLFYDALSLILG